MHEQDVFIDYVNWRGVRGYRHIRPIRMAYEANEYHPEQQWLVVASDIDKGAERTFALAAIKEWFTGDEIAKARELVKEKASTSFLQRRLQVGYNRAAAIMTMFEELDWVSKPNARGVRAPR